jgi:hypothetical protein
MTESQLREVMKYHLRHFRGKGDPAVTDNTIHNTILKTDDGSPSSANLYRGLVQWSLSVTGDKDPSWPSNWLTLSVAALAPRLLA